jgi:hypothetical protein
MEAFMNIYGALVTGLVGRICVPVWQCLKLSQGWSGWSTLLCDPIPSEDSHAGKLEKVLVETWHPMLWILCGEIIAS